MQTKLHINTVYFSLSKCIWKKLPAVNNVTMYKMCVSLSIEKHDLHRISKFITHKNNKKLTLQPIEQQNRARFLKTILDVLHYCLRTTGRGGIKSSFRKSPRLRFWQQVPRRAPRKDKQVPSFIKWSDLIQTLGPIFLYHLPCISSMGDDSLPKNLLQ